MANDPPLKTNSPIVIHIEGEEDMDPDYLEQLRAWIIKKEMQQRIWDQMEANGDFDRDNEE
jgi:hypothetical protein